VYPGFLEITLAVCLFFYIRNRKHLRAENHLESMVSRESSFLFNNLLLLAACFAVLWGTLFPLLSELFRGFKIAVGPPFFNRVLIPIGLGLIYLMAVGPLLAWRRTSLASFRKNLAVPEGVALAVAIAVAVVVRPWSDTSQIYSLMSFYLAALVITAAALEFYRGGRVLQGKLQSNLVGAMYHLARRNTRRYGGYIAHFGFVVVVIGLAGAAFNQDKEQEMGLHDRLKVGSYEFVGQKYTEDDNANYTSLSAILDVYKNGKFVCTLFPESRTFKVNEQRNTIPAVHTSLQEDIYVVYEGFNPDTDRPIIKAFVHPLVVWIWIGVAILVFGTGLALVPNAAQLRSPVPLTVRETAAAGLETAGVVK